ncbi:MAG: sigma-70 family RNA polymerase sigma factor [Deltaproteobacteria bacterium]|nr:sigma-70 family RNA polymerase sigma factor [Deltaproteobacteria bacterium]
MGLAKSIAIKTARMLRLNQDLTDEAVALANQGLVVAAQRYDPRRGIAFSTFAYYRIRGAIFDGLRSMGVLARTRVHKVQREERVDSYLESEGQGGQPGGALEDALSNFADRVANLATMEVLAFAAETVEQSADASVGSVYDQVEDVELFDVVRRAVESLPESERSIIELSYFKDKSLAEAGKEMGLSRSWASRLHGRAIKMLQEVVNTS